MPRPSAPESPAELIHVWTEAIGAFADLAERVPAARWTAPTELPGWSVGDVVAHVVGIERSIAGDGVPEHEPEWERLPHVRSDFARLTELDVDARRGVDQAEVVAELRQIIERRRHQLISHIERTADPAGTVSGPFGWELPFPRLLQIRIFDISTHQSDIRVALGEDGALEGEAASVALGRIIHGWQIVWGRIAPAGSVLEVATPTGSFAIQRDETGRSHEIPPGSRAATLRLEVSDSELLRLATGRMPDREREGLAARTSADPSAESLVASFFDAASVTP